MKVYVLLTAYLLLIVGLNANNTITAEFSHDFSSNPYEKGFIYRGLLYDESLYEESLPPDPPVFYWNDINSYLSCHWDSHKNNAVFAKMLPFWVDETSDFEFRFEIEFDQIESHDFHQIAIGFRNLDTLNFSRSGSRFGDSESLFICKDIIEWGYIPDNTWGDPLVYPVIATSRGDDFIFNWVMNTTTLVPEKRYRIHQYWDSSTRLFQMEMWIWEEGQWIALNGEDISTHLELPPDREFRVNALAVNQYKDYADFWDWGSPDNKNVITGKIYNISYWIDLNKTIVGDWQFYDR